MSNYGWTNEDGEPIMDGAAYRFEQELDAHYDEYERQFDAYDEPYDYDEPECDGKPADDPAHNGWSWSHEGQAFCDWCDTRLPQYDEDYDPSPCCPDPGCGGNPCTFPGYADNH